MKSWKYRLLSLVTVAVVCPLNAAAETFVPAVAYDQSGKFDQSFNEGIYKGAEHFKKETGVAYREGQISHSAQKEQLLRNLARRGATMIVAAGFLYKQAVETVAKEFPNVKFTLLDVVANGPNVQSILFKEQEGAYVVGVAAALASKSGKIGFIGGMDVPLIRAFGCGYIQGARSVNPKIVVIENIVGTTPQAFNDPARGAELGKSQFDRGVDVVFAVAGGTGAGILQAAKDAHKLAIGVDSNQNAKHPGSVLTSMVKRVDAVVYQTLKQGHDGSWQPGVQVRGLKDGAVDWSLDRHNRALIRATDEQKIDAAKKAIVAGTIHVVDFREHNACKLP